MHLAAINRAGRPEAERVKIGWPVQPDIGRPHFQPSNFRRGDQGWRRGYLVAVGCDCGSVQTPIRPRKHAITNPLPTDPHPKSIDKEPDNINAQPMSTLPDAFLIVLVWITALFPEVTST